MKNVISSILVTIILLIGCNNFKEKLYYDNGQIRAISPLKDGVRHGRAYFYFEDGELSSECSFVDGLRQGQGLFYYPNGAIKQNVLYRNDTIVKSASFRKDGTLEIIKNYNDDGKLIEYNYYLDSGRIDPDPQKKYPLFITKKDTVNQGEIYKGEIHLGHRFYDDVYIILGDTTNPELVSKPFLKRTLSYISVFEINTDTCVLGKNAITGLVFEKSDTCKGCGWLAPFKHEFYVLPNPNSSSFER